MTAVLHTWGSAMTHHPHLHMIVPGGGLSPGGDRLGVVAPRVPAAGARAGQAVPPLVPHPADGALRGRAARVPRQPRGPQRPACVPASLGTNPEEALGGLRQATVRRTRDGAGLSVPLHAPGGDLEPPPRPLRRHRRPARPVSTISVGCSGPRRRPRSRRRRSRTTCVRHAHAAAGTWSSSRPSNAGADHEHRRMASPRPGTSRHDPAWPDLVVPRRSCASGDDKARDDDAAHRAATRFRP